MEPAPSEPVLKLSTPVEEIPGVTARQAQGLRALGISNLGWLAAYLPMRHEKIEAEAAIADLIPDQTACTRGDVTATRVVRSGKMPRFEVVLHDGTARLDLVWFNMLFLRNSVMPGVRLRVQGKVKSRGPGIQMANAKFEVLNAADEEPAESESRMRPVYPATESFKSWAIERVMQHAVPLALPLIEDHLPEAFRKDRSMPELREAYRMQHLANDEEEVLISRRRLAYDELLYLQLGVQLKRAHLRGSLRAPKLKWSVGIDKHIRERFPFTLTEDQEEVIKEIAKDLSSSVPANRLVQGDVGSGKTVVALYAMLLAVASEAQASLMAPTELLAEQHHASISRMLAGSRVRCELLTGTTPAAAREALLARLAAGEIDILVGTHALLTESVKFKSLAVAIIDEQHRFGVVQRAGLREKASDAASTPHVLVMTATPIPRTLAITLFGDLDVSSIKGLPPGRKPIVTRVVAGAGRGGVYEEIKARIARGQQAYVVAPAIDGGVAEETLEAAATGVGSEAEPTKMLRDIRTVAKELETVHLPGARVAMLHGQLSRPLREAVMERFRSGQIDVLVATTVIEVGVDVPNATAMVIEQADRFGLAQLHQLRGRVGRGSEDSICYLIADPTTDLGKERLSVMEKISNGFDLSEKDLELRGPGEVFGSRQSGLPPFKVADLTRDRQLLTLARRDATAWVKQSPKLALPEEQLLKRRMLKAYGEHLGLGDVG
jgi:ATP-dependent DNA helicase RecG